MSSCVLSLEGDGALFSFMFCTCRRCDIFDTAFVRSSMRLVSDISNRWMSCSVTVSAVLEGSSLGSARHEPDSTTETLSLRSGWDSAKLSFDAEQFEDEFSWKLLSLASWPDNIQLSYASLLLSLQWSKRIFTNLQKTARASSGK